MNLLISIVNASNHTKCVPLSNQRCMTQPTLINWHCNEGSLEFNNFPFEVKLYRYVISCNIIYKL